MKTIFPLLFIFFAVVGLVDSAYITYNEFMGVVPPCDVNGFNCESVLQSKWAHIGPLPISVLGLFFYTVVLFFASLHLLEFDMRTFISGLVKKSKHPIAQKLRFITPLDVLVFLTGFGFLFSLYLVTLMQFVIGSWCLYCAISAINSLLLFISTRIYAQHYVRETPIFTHFFTSSIVGWLYKNILKKICFALDPEFVHHSIVGAGALMGTNAVTKFLMAAVFNFSNPALEKNIDGITFPNPVGLAAGFDYNADLTQILPSVGFGFHTIGTVTLHPYGGNPRPRLSRYPNSNALLVNKGFKSPGAKEVIRKLSGLTFDIPVGISIGSTNTYFKNTQEQILDILQTFLLFEQSVVRHAYYELNISCPNTKGGQPFTTTERLSMLLEAFEHLALTRPVYVKMPIHLSDAETKALLKIIDSHSIAGVIFGNLQKDKNVGGMDKAERTHWQTAPGYVSGKPTWERSNHLIKLTRGLYKNRFTIIGTGGIFTPEDAAHKLALGADLVQIITGMIFEGPQLIGQIQNHLVTKSSRAQ